MKQKLLKVLSYFFFIFFINTLSMVSFKVIMNSSVKIKTNNDHSYFINSKDIYKPLDEDEDIIDLVNELPHTGSYRTRSKQIIKGIVIHHTASDTTATPEEIAVIGRNRFGVGHSYHYQIKRNGEIVKTNYVYSKTAHLENYNSTTIGIVLTGNYSLYNPTDYQIIQLIRLGRMLKRLVPSIEYVKGHRDFSPNQCPGNNVYKHMKYIEEKILEK